MVLSWMRANMDFQDVARAAQLASVLEVSGYPKPGNVHRTANLDDVIFEQFVASAVAIGPILLEVAERGFHLGKRKAGYRHLRLGEAIRQAIQDTMRWQTNGNTNLGIVLLLMPLTAAAAMTLARAGNRKLNISKLRKNLSQILKSTTPDDAVNVYEAILLANPAGLGRIPNLDIRDERSKKRIVKEGISLYDVMKTSSTWDNISKEWVTGMPITFEFGYPFVKRIYKTTRNINSTTVHTFMEILAKYPDTMVQRVHGESVANKVSERARVIVGKGGMLTATGRALIRELDGQLRRSDINPGTTADLTASSLMLAIIDGLRP